MEEVCIYAAWKIERWVFIGVYLRMPILNSEQTLKLGSNLNSLSALPDQENLGTAVRISFQSCTRAEIQDIAFVLPVDGGHL